MSGISTVENVQVGQKVIAYCNFVTNFSAHSHEGIAFDGGNVWALFHFVAPLRISFDIVSCMRLWCLISLTTVECGYYEMKFWRSCSLEYFWFIFFTRFWPLLQARNYSSEQDPILAPISLFPTFFAQSSSAIMKEFFAPEPFHNSRIRLYIKSGTRSICDQMLYVDYALMDSQYITPDRKSNEYPKSP